jgi:O-antigen/teichoic acid export membrane protein
VASKNGGGHRSPASERGFPTLSTSTGTAEPPAPAHADNATVVLRAVSAAPGEHFHSGTRDGSPDGHARSSSARLPRKREHPLLRWFGRVLRWVFVSAVSARFGTVVIVLALARMVPPSDLGAFAVAIVALLVVRAVAGLGVSRAIEEWRGDPQEIAPTAMTISLAAGLASYVGCYVAAPAFAAAMGAPAAARAVRLLVLSTVICGAAAGPRGVLQRRAPRSRVMVDQAGNWVGVAVTVALAAARLGPMSLALGAIAGSLLSAGLFAGLAPGSVRIGFSRHMAAELLRAALPFAASSTLICAITSADLVVIGRLLHPRLLGFYVLALCCASWPAALLSQPVRQAAPAALARFRRSPKIAGSVFASSARLLASLTLPTCMLIANLAGPLIHVLYGPSWAPTARVLVWLAPLAVLQVFYEVAHDFFVVLASTRRALIFQLSWLTALVPTLVAGARHFGIVGVALLELAVAAVMLAAWYLEELRPAGVRPGRYVVWLKAALAAAAGLIAFRALRMIHDDGTELAIGCALTLAVICLLVYRMRAVLAALRRAAASVAAGPWAVGGLSGLAPSSVFELTRYPVLSGVPSAAAARAFQPTTQSLSSKIRAGARWSMLNVVVLRLSGSIISAFLARTVFDPRVWGLYAVSQVVLTLLLSANELGVCAAIIRWDGDVRTVARTILTFSVATSTVIYAGLYVFAPDIARLLGSPAATEVVRVLCICVIIDGFAGVPAALITRQFAQRRQMACDSINFLVSTGVMLPLAFTGHGAMSFAWGAVAGCTVATVMYNVLAPGVLPGWNTGDARRALQFGLPLAGAALLTLGVFNVDSMIVGATLGPVMLGLYALAFNISNWPVSVISLAVTRVSFAGFSRVASSQQRLTGSFTRALAVLMALAVPACVLLATLAEPLVHAVYGQRWIAAAPVLSLLAILGLLRVAATLAYDYLAAAGKRHLLMWIQALWLGALIPALLIGARTRGIFGVGAGHVLVAAGVVGPVFLWALTRTGVTVRSMAGACIRPVVGGILMTVVSLVTIRVAGSGLAGLAAATGAALAVYVPAVFPMRVLLRSPLPGDAATELSEAGAA